MAIDTERVNYLGGRQVDALELAAHEILRLLEVQADAVTDCKSELRAATRPGPGLRGSAIHAAIGGERPGEG